MSSNYSLGPHFDAFIKEQLANDRYASASEIMCAALRLLEEHENNHEMLRITEAQRLDWLKGEIQKAIDSPKADGKAAMKHLYARIAGRNDELSAHEAA
jgi:antitoxin ParD1/3/4